MLSKRVKELLDLVTLGKPGIGKGKKLVIGDGEPRLEADTVAFVKSLTTPAQSDLVKSHLAGRRVATATSLFSRASDIVARVSKRAVQFPISESEMQGGTPTVGAKPRTEPGLSDADLRVLEQEITTGNPALAPAMASKLFLESYRVIAANGGRRISVGE